MKGEGFLFFFVLSFLIDMVDVFGKRENIGRTTVDDFRSRVDVSLVVSNKRSLHVLGVRGGSDFHPPSPVKCRRSSLETWDVEWT